MSHLDAAEEAADPATYPAAIVGWYATVLLALLYWFSILDRFIIALLVDPIKHDLGISDLQFGMLHGFAFAVTFSLFGLAAGTLADRFSRRWVIFASVAAWSLATTACGLAKSFGHLMLARVGVGAGEAGLNPAATSILADLFPPERLTSALAVYALGATVGSGCAYLFGGMIVDWVSAASSLSLPIVGEIRSWQAAFFVVGAPGLALAALVFTMPEPVRRGRRPQRLHSGVWHGALAGYGELFAFIRLHRRFFFFHYVGFTFAALVVTGSGSWYPAHMGRAFGWSSSEIGLSLGIALVAGGGLGKLLCGWCVDAMYRRGFRDAQFRWYAICLLLAVPVGAFATTSDDPWLFLIGIALFLVLLSPMPVCATAALNLVTPNRLRGSGIAFFGATAGLVGVSLGPILMAAASDTLFGGGAIGKGIAVVIAVCCPVASVLLWCGRGAMREAMAGAELPQGRSTSHDGRPGQSSSMR